MSNFLESVQERMRSNRQLLIDNAVYTERQNCISISTMMLLEAEVDEEKIVFLLQKYWDLRPSEARNILYLQKTGDKMNK